MRTTESMLILILVVAGVFRMIHFRSDYIHHPDEVIPVGVYQYMTENGTLDNNWVNAEVREEFKYDQYNFSSYIYFSSLFTLGIESTLDLAGLSINTTVILFRFFSAILGIFCVYLTFLIGREILRDSAWIPALFVALNPLMIQDSLYARPETFVTLITLIVVLLAIKKSETRYWYLSIFLCGYVIATKISMIPILVFPFFSFVRYHLSFKAAFIGLLTVLIGFFIGVPYGFINPEEFTFGIQYLFNHYAGFRPPYSPVDKGMFFHMGTYFLQSFGYLWVGLFVLFPLIGSPRLKQPWLWGIYAFVWIHLIYFSTKGVFFERNFSHIIPFAMIVAAYPIALLGKMHWTWLAVSCTLYKPLLVTYLIFVSLTGEPFNDRMEYEEHLRGSHEVTEIYYVGLMNEQDLEKVRSEMALDSIPRIWGVVDYNDRITEWNLLSLEMFPDIEKVGEHTSIFDDFQASTLHTYHDPSIHYFLKVN